MDPNQPMYWAERWELFKHTYIVAGWGWKRAITKVEYWARAASASARVHAGYCARCWR
jgi:hypothetical protein